MRKITLGERLAVIETLMGNHLKHHESLLKWLLCPIAVGVVLTLIGVYCIK